MSSGGTVGATRNRTELFLKYRNQARGAARPIGLPGTSPTSRQAERCARLCLLRSACAFCCGKASSWLGGEVVRLLAWQTVPSVGKHYLLFLLPKLCLRSAACPLVPADVCFHHMAIRHTVQRSVTIASEHRRGASAADLGPMSTSWRCQAQRLLRIRSHADACCLLGRGTSRLLEAALASTADGASAAELGAAGVASALPPRYVDFKEATRTEMCAIRQKMGELQARPVPSPAASQPGRIMRRPSKSSIHLACHHASAPVQTADDGDGAANSTSVAGDVIAWLV